MNVNLSIDEALKLAITHHQANRLSEADSIYRAILQKQPKHSDANHNLGILAMSVGKLDLALSFLKVALEENPKVIQYWTSYISALLAQNRIQDAKNILEQGKAFGLPDGIIASLELQINSKYLDNIFGIVVAHRESGNYADGITILHKLLDSNTLQDFQKAIAFAHLSHLSLLFKQDDIAKESINTAFSLDPNSSIVLRNKARVLLKMQKIDDALAATECALKIEPENLENLQILASAYRAKKEYQKALEIVEYVLGKKPDYAEALANRGLIRFAQNDNLGAIVDIESALSIKPYFNDLVSLLVSLYYKNKEITKAIALLEKVLQEDPNNIDYLVNLGEFKRQIYSIKESVNILQKAVSLAPDNANAWANLGTALHGDGKLEEAQDAYSKALEINPKLAEVANNLAALALQTTSYESALPYIEKAILYQPDNPTLLANKGSILIKLRQNPNEVGELGNKIISMAPNDSSGYRLLGLLYKETGEFDKAAKSFEAALLKDPSSVGLYENLALIQRDLLDIEAAKKNYLQALQINPNRIQALSGLLFVNSYMAEEFNQKDLELAVRYGSLCKEKAALSYDCWMKHISQQPLRIGMVSGDFRSHPVSYFLESFMKKIDKSRIELIAYPTYHKTDDTTVLIRQCFSDWKPIYDKSDMAAAKLIHNDGVQILIDLSGHTGHNRLPLFSYKPAPVQVSWLGYFATTGISEIDYILGDAYVTPEEEISHFVEKIWRLPDSYLCFSQPIDDCRISDLPALQNSHITFGCFNNLSKVNDKVISLWAKIMTRLPQAKLMLKAKELTDSKNIFAILEKFATHGISSERLILKGGTSRIEHMMAYGEVDIALDPFPYPGGTTSLEALWMGVPVITKKGNTFLSRVGESIAHNLGQSEWVAQNDDDYIKKAIYFASNIEHLSRLRHKLRDMLICSPLMNTERFAKNFENAMYAMWQNSVKNSDL